MPSVALVLHIYLFYRYLELSHFASNPVMNVRKLPVIKLLRVPLAIPMSYCCHLDHNLSSVNPLIHTTEGARLTLITDISRLRNQIIVL